MVDPVLVDFFFRMKANFVEGPLRSFRRPDPDRDVTQNVPSGTTGRGNKGAVRADALRWIQASGVKTRFTLRLRPPPCSMTRSMSAEVWV